jgi:hypothetical protein
MDLIISQTPYPFLLSSSPLTPTLQNPIFFTLTPFSSNRRKLKLRASSTADSNGADGSSWSQSLERASKRFLLKFGDMVKKEIGVDLGDGVVKAGEFVDGVKKNVGNEFQTLSLSEFVEWNRFEHWKVTNSNQLLCNGFCLFNFIHSDMTKNCFGFGCWI